MRTTALLSGALTLLVLAGHPETLLHGVALGTLYFAFELWRVRFARWRRATIAGLAAGVITLLLTAISIVPLIDAIPQTEEFQYRANGYAPAASTITRTLHVIAADLLPMMEGSAGVEVAQHSKEIAH